MPGSTAFVGSLRRVSGCSLVLRLDTMEQADWKVRVVAGDLHRVEV